MNVQLAVEKMFLRSKFNLCSQLVLFIIEISMYKLQERLSIIFKIVRLFEQ